MPDPTPALAATQTVAAVVGALLMLGLVFGLGVWAGAHLAAERAYRRGRADEVDAQWRARWTTPVSAPVTFHPPVVRTDAPPVTGRPMLVPTLRPRARDAHAA